MSVHKSEGTVFEDEIEYGSWTVCGQQVPVFFQDVNDGCYAVFVWDVCV